jgi:AcrR family transcriptional regulator
MKQVAKSRAGAPAPKIKLSRAAQSEDVKRRLFEAAIQVVGRAGYAEASVARITDLAGVAQGTFYNHFGSRQELLDQLLPTVGQRMVRFIRERMEAADTEAEREAARFRAFFDFLNEVPEFLRILNEAEFFAPSGYEQHLDNISGAYVRILKRARSADAVGDYTDQELEAVVHILMGARAYLSRRYGHEEGRGFTVPEHVMNAYEKLLGSGLFRTRNP